jgi:spore germination cell wall hydrolase CwlJ-like protein
MSQKSRDVLLRSDRVLAAALVLVVAAISAEVGAAAVNRPYTEQLKTTVVMAKVEAPVPAVAPAEPELAMTAQAVKSASEELVMSKLLAEHRCLSEVMYYEARGEGLKGQKAIAEVVFHRMRTGNYGQSICAVVYEGANQPGCQFSFACDGNLRQKKSGQAWMQAQILAARILTGEERLNDQTGGATSFHATSVQPDWANDLQKTVQIGNHIFYKNPGRSRAM